MGVALLKSLKRLGFLLISIFNRCYFTFIYWGVEYNSYNMITWDMTKIYALVPAGTHAYIFVISLVTML